MMVLSELLKPEGKRAEGFNGIKTIIIDSITAWKENALVSAVDRNVRRELQLEASGVGQARKIKLPQIQERGEVAYGIHAILHGLRQMPYHMILIAALEEERDTTTGAVVAYKPMISDKLRQTISQMMSWIWFVQEKDGQHRLLTLPKGVYKIKTRNPRFVDAIKAETRKRVSPEKADSAEGWWLMSMDTNYQSSPSLADLYNIYLQAVKSA